jgi:hypothetical protein
VTARYVANNKLCGQFSGIVDSCLAMLYFYGLTRSQRRAAAKLPESDARLNQIGFPGYKPVYGCALRFLGYNALPIAKCAG